MISCVHPSSGGPIRTSGGRIKGGPEESVTMADAQLLEWDIPGDEDAVVENHGTTSGSSELREEASGTETQAGFAGEPLRRTHFVATTILSRTSSSLLSQASCGRSVQG